MCTQRPKRYDLWLMLPPSDFSLIFDFVYKSLGRETRMNYKAIYSFSVVATKSSYGINSAEEKLLTC